MDLKETKEYLEGIQLSYEVEGYVSTNTADEVLKIAFKLIKQLENGGN